MTTIAFTGDDAADRLLSDNPLALLMGMLLDQQIPMERAFAGPARLAERLDGPLDAAAIAAMSPDELEALFRQTPAIHRFPGSMAKRVHALCQELVERFDGDASAVWTRAETGRDLFRTLTSLPGFGKQKAQVFTAVLAKRVGVAPPGWEEAAGDYAKDGYRSVADVTSPESLDRVREFKRARKAG